MNFALLDTAKLYLFDLDHRVEIVQTKKILTSNMKFVTS